MNIVTFYIKDNLKNIASDSLKIYIVSKQYSASDFSKAIKITGATIDRIIEKRVNNIDSLIKLMALINKEAGEEIFKGF